jgi:ABC-2 type transport system permease protein
MAKVWIVARHEYTRMVRRRSFLIGTLGLPLLIGVVMAISIVVSIGDTDHRPLGYVDLSGVLDPGVQPPARRADRTVELRAFADEPAARAALEAGEIQAFYVIPAGYVQSGSVRLYTWDDEPGSAVRSRFDDLLAANLVAGLPDDVQRRAVEGVSVTVRSADGRRELDSENLMAFLLPFGAGLFFTFAVMTSAGYLLQAVTTEKENRTMEVMITSLAPEPLIGGKALGLMAVSLTQLGIWGLAVGVGLAIGAQRFGVLRSARVPWASMGIAILYFLPAYALVAGMMITIGSAVTETRQGQQISGIINLLFTSPFFFVALILANPDSPVLVFLSLFPTTAFITVTMRWSLTVVPLWQMALSWVLLVASAGASLWVAARVLRAGMLHYGQRLDLRAVVRAVRANKGMNHYA